MALEDAGGFVPRPHATPGGDPARLVGGERLPCGRRVSDAWDRARGHPPGPDPHTARCPYCREAADGLTALDSTARALRDRRPSARTVAARVVDAVRAEARLGRLVPLDDAERDLRVAEAAAAKVLRRAADGVHGVRAASCRLVPDEDGGTSVAVAMTLATTLDQPLPARGSAVRRAVAYAAERRLGLAVGRIDLRFVAVLETGPRPATERLAPEGPARASGP